MSATYHSRRGADGLRARTTNYFSSSLSRSMCLFKQRELKSREREKERIVREGDDGMMVDGRRGKKKERKREGDDGVSMAAAA